MVSDEQQLMRKSNRGGYALGNVESEPSSPMTTEMNGFGAYRSSPMTTKREDDRWYREEQQKSAITPARTTQTVTS
jgi:hypothetical protein